MVIGTGAEPIRPSLPGIDADGIYGVQTLDDGLALRAALERERPRRAVIVGAGYIGLELAEAMHAWGVDGVWAAGDCTEKYHRISRRHVRLPLGTHANKEGRTAGINIGGGYATFPGVVGTAAMKICSTEVARTGLGELEAVQAGFEPVSAVVESTTRAGYYPGARPIRTKLIAERGTGRPLRCPACISRGRTPFFAGLS